MSCFLMFCQGFYSDFLWAFFEKHSVTDVHSQYAAKPFVSIAGELSKALGGSRVGE